MALDEFKNLKIIYEQLKNVNFEIYLKFFKTFCKQPEDAELMKKMKN